MDSEEYYDDPPPPLPCGRVKKYSARLAVLAMHHTLNAYQEWGITHRYGICREVGLNVLDAVSDAFYEYAKRYLCYSSLWDYMDAKNGRGKYRG